MPSAPGAPVNAVRQAVVRLISKQSLVKLDANAEGKVEQKDIKEVKEYIVVQKQLAAGVEKDWIVWGTVTESDWRKMV